MLNLDIRNELTIDVQSLVGRMVAVLGITGSGKTNTAAVLVEELLTAGVPMTIVDIEGEYYGLKERFEILVAGRSVNVDLELSTTDQAARLAQLSVKNLLSVVLDVSEFDDSERFEFLLGYFNALWETNFKERKPYQIFLEEAHEFIPQGGRTPLKQILTRLALRGRKRGFGVVVMSQRSAKVDKDVLTQASFFLLHRVVHPIDLKVYEELIPLPAREVDSMVARLERGQAIALNNGIVSTVNIRLRHTLHVGATPELGGKAFEPKKIDSDLLRDLQKSLTQAQPADRPGQSKPTNKLIARVKELEESETTLKAKIEELEAQVKTLKDLKVSFEGQLVAMGAVPDQPTPRPASTPAQPKPIPAPARTLRAELLPQERTRLERELKKLVNLRGVEIAILETLLNQDGSAMTALQLSHRTGYSFNTIKDRRKLSNLFKLSFFEEEGGFFSTQVVVFTEQGLPGVDPAVVKKAIQGRL